MALSLTWPTRWLALRFFVNKLSSQMPPAHDFPGREGAVGVLVASERVVRYASVGREKGDYYRCSSPTQRVSGRRALGAFS